MRSWLDVVSLGWLRFDRTTIRHVLYGIIAGLTLSITSTSFALEYQKRKKEHIARQYKPRPIELRSDEIIKGVTGLIGNTPLVRINSLSDALGVEILGKAEFLNPGGSVKDRVALKIIDDAEKQGLLHPHTGSRIFEGTVGSTGISIATVAKARGYDTTIIMPDDVAEEKVKTLLALGAQVERVRPASMVDKKQFVNLAKQRAMSFGVEDSLSDHAANPRSHLLPTPSSSVLVSTTGTDTLGPDHAVESAREEEELRTKPRGFFADQFEVFSTRRDQFPSSPLTPRPLEQEQLRGALRGHRSRNMAPDEWTRKRVCIGSGHRRYCRWHWPVSQVDGRGRPHRSGGSGGQRLVQQGEARSHVRSQGGGGDEAPAPGGHGRRGHRDQPAHEEYGARFADPQRRVPDH